MRRFNNRLISSLFLIGCIFLVLACTKKNTGPGEYTGFNDDPNEDASGSTGEPIGSESEIIKYGQFNIEYDNKNNTANPWNDRKYLVQNIFNKYEFDIVTINEAYYSQLADIKELLPEYAYYGSNVRGLTTDKILTVGILYKKEMFTIKESGRFWLSSTPSQPSKGFGWYQYRICNWAKFEDKQTGVEFFVFSIHLGFKEKPQSSNLAMGLLQSKISSIAEGYPTFLSGDFNFSQTQPPYAELTNKGFFTDSYWVTEKHLTPYQGTFGDYSRSYSARKIDYIFLANCNNIKVKSQQVIVDSYGGKYPSDHYPVMIKAIIPSKCQESSIVKDTIRENFEFAVIQNSYLQKETEVTPSGPWIFKDALLKESTTDGDARKMSPRLKGQNLNGSAGYIQTNFFLHGLKGIKVKYSSMNNGDKNADYKLKVQVSKDNKSSWQTLGTVVVEKGEIGEAEYSPDIQSNNEVWVRLVNDSPDTGNHQNGNQINILEVTFVQP